MASLLQVGEKEIVCLDNELTPSSFFSAQHCKPQQSFIQIQILLLFLQGNSVCAVQTQQYDNNNNTQIHKLL